MTQVEEQEDVVFVVALRCAPLAAGLIGEVTGAVREATGELGVDAVTLSMVASHADQIGAHEKLVELGFDPKHIGKIVPPAKPKAAKR